VPDLATFQLAFATAMDRADRRSSLERQPGFAVYRNTAPSALLGTLAGAYPVTEAILGSALFEDAALAFIRRHPPKDAVLVSYGAGFAEHLEEQDWAADLPYLPGVASIERLCAWADLEGLASADWEKLHLPLHPACRFTWLTAPALTIWQAHRDGFETLEPEWRAEGVLITRPECDLLVQPIDAPTHRMLFGLMLRESAGQAAAATAGVYPEANIASIFATLVNSGALAVPLSLERKN
jgi:hypothetical protein